MPRIPPYQEAWISSTITAVRTMRREYVIQKAAFGNGGSTAVAASKSHVRRQESVIRSGPCEGRAGAARNPFHLGHGQEGGHAAEFVAHWMSK